MAALIAALMLSNTWRSATDPVAFARYFGIVAAADVNPAFVYVYASRALFLGVITALLLWKRQFAALSYFAAAAIIMPVCDALLVFRSGGEPTIIMRHAATALYLLVTAALLARWASQKR